MKWISEKWCRLRNCELIDTCQSLWRFEFKSDLIDLVFLYRLQTAACFPFASVVCHKHTHTHTQVALECFARFSLHLIRMLNWDDNNFKVFIYLYTQKEIGTTDVNTTKHTIYFYPCSKYAISYISHYRLWQFRCDITNVTSVIRFVNECAKWKIRQMC